MVLSVVTFRDVFAGCCFVDTSTCLGKVVREALMSWATVCEHGTSLSLSPSLSLSLRARRESSLFCSSLLFVYVYIVLLLGFQTSTMDGPQMSSLTPTALQSATAIGKRTQA